MQRHALDPVGHDLPGESRLLRAFGPAAPIELPGGVPAWGITSSDLLRKILTSDDVSKNPRKHWPAWRDGTIPPDWLLLPWIAMENMLTTDGSEHKRLRSLLTAAFTPRRVSALEPQVRQTTETLLNELSSAAASDGVVDARELFAHRLPFDTIANLFGLPSDWRNELRKCIDVVLAPVPGADVTGASKRTVEILQQLIDTKRINPGDDLTSDLLAAVAGGDRTATEAEVLDTLRLVIAAGFETTVGLIDQALTAMLTHPKQLELVLSERATWDDVIDETLRWQPSVPHMPLRYAINDIKIDQTTTITAGDAIVACIGAANRDPEVHGPDADLFDITRATRRQHFAFGHGPHACLGTHLARLEAATALREFFARFPNATLAVPVAELQPISMVANGHQRLPIRVA